MGNNIEEINDILGMFEVMTALGISCEGLQTVDQMRTRVRTELNASVENPCWTAGQVRTLQMECI